MAQLSTTPLAQRLGIKPGHCILLINAPAEYAAMLDPLPENAALVVEADGSGFDMVHLFVREKRELDAHAQAALAALKPRGLLWISYPKKSSKVKTDMTRDHGWDVIREAQWEGVKQVSVDNVWSALRFRPRHEIGT